MLVPRDGVCGVSAPVGGDALFYARNVPVGATVDGPLDDAEGPYAAPVAKTASYQATRGAYCAGPSVPKASLPPTCFDQCAGAEPAHNCTGFFAAHDTAESTALCLSADACVDACTEDVACAGVSVHKTLDRCFLRTSCTARASAEYDLYLKVGGADGTVGRRLTSEWWPTSEAAKGYSWSQLLRFPSLSVPAGAYKACFCDSALTSPAGVCRANKADFKVEIGRVHVSGVECLLQEDKYTRGTCVVQGYGGLRCHDVAPALTPPGLGAAAAATVSVVTEGPGDAEAAAGVSAWCLYGPEEETAHHPICEFERRLS